MSKRGGASKATANKSGFSALSADSDGAGEDDLPLADVTQPIIPEPPP